MVEREMGVGRGWTRLGRTKARTLQPQFKKIGVVAGGSSLPEREGVEQRECDGHGCREQRADKVPAPYAEEEEEREHRRECPADEIPKEVSLQSPRLAGGIVRAIRFREAQLVFRVGVHLLKR